MRQENRVGTVEKKDRNQLEEAGAGGEQQRRKMNCDKVHDTFV